MGDVDSMRVATAACSTSTGTALSGGSSRGRDAVAHDRPPRGRQAGREYERIGERVSIFLNGRVWYANWQEGPKQKRQTLGTRNHDVARQKARSLEAQLSGAVTRQAGTFDIAGVVQAYLDVQESNDRAAKTMMKYRHVLNRFAAHCRDAGVRLMHAISVQTLDDFAVQRRRDGMGNPDPREDVASTGRSSRRGGLSPAVPGLAPWGFYVGEGQEEGLPVLSSRPRKRARGRMPKRACVE